MKKLLSFVVMTMSLSAFAQTIELNQKEISIDAAEAVIARTNKTPKKVEITMTVPMQKSVCEESGIQHVMRTSSVHCGNDVIYRSRTVEVCTRRDPNNKDRCLMTRLDRRQERVLVARTCMVPETVCLRYGTVVVPKRDNMTIEFSKKLHALADSEADLFKIKAAQKNYDGDTVVYELEALETIAPVKVKRAGRLFGSSEDDLEVKPAK